MNNKLSLTFILAPFLFAIWLIGCSESPDPADADPYYGALDDLDDGVHEWWNPYRPKPGRNVTTFIFSEEPLNLRVLNLSDNDTTKIIGWRLEKTKGWWTNEYRDMFLVEIEFYCETDYRFLIRSGIPDPEHKSGMNGIGGSCEEFEF